MIRNSMIKNKYTVDVLLKISHVAQLIFLMHFNVLL